MPSMARSPGARILSVRSSSTAHCARRARSANPGHRTRHRLWLQRLENMRANGVRSLDVQCNECRQRVIVKVDHLPGDLTVWSFAKMVCGRSAPTCARTGKSADRSRPISADNPYSREQLSVADHRAQRFRDRKASARSKETAVCPRVLRTASRVTGFRPAGYKSSSHPRDCRHRCAPTSFSRSASAARVRLPSRPAAAQRQAPPRSQTAPVGSIWRRASLE
jgi:hypothetical protein